MTSLQLLFFLNTYGMPIQATKDHLHFALGQVQLFALGQVQVQLP